MKLAPIVLFTYNRPVHTQKVLEALSANAEAKESVLYVFCDGAKDNADTTTLENIAKTREVVKAENRFLKIIVTEQTKNKGLANSIIDGVTEIVNKFGKVIVMEDDLITSNYFLKFMNEALTIYEKQEEVACISAYIYPVKDLPELFFIKGSDCWGWATWRRGWDLFESDGKKLLDEIESKKLSYAFDLNGSYPYTAMLNDQISGKNNSWAIRWYASAFLKNKLCLYPGKSLVNNIGMDGSGTHGDSVDQYKLEPINYPLGIKNVKTEVNEIALSKIAAYFDELIPKNHYKPSFLKRVLKKIVPSFFVSLYHKLSN